MRILVFNCGSSSLNYKVFETTELEGLAPAMSGKAHRIGVIGSEPSFIEHHAHGQTQKQTVPLTHHAQAADLILQHLKEQNVRVEVIGHRIVHGGSDFRESVRLTEETLAQMKACLHFAPIHNPSSVSVIELCRRALPEARQFMSFDTAFHASLPPCAYTYALPAHLVQKYGLRKYGAHGLSYQFVVHEAARYLNQPVESLRMVACHLGTGGSSVAAVREGVSVDTSMGYSPLPGLMMSTRTGDLDPLLALYLMENKGYGPEALSDLLNKQSGLLGISGFSSDLRDLIPRMARMDEPGHERAALAFQMYVYRLKKYIGAYAALLHGLDVLIFTDDIGLQLWQVREKACEGLEWCGVTLDAQANRRASTSQITRVSAPASRVQVLAMPTDEERVIGLEGVKLFLETGHVDL